MKFSIMKKNIIIIFTILLSTLYSFSQVAPTIVWDKTYGDKKNDVGYKILELNNHDLVLACSQSKGFGGYLWMIKTDFEGNMLNQIFDKSMYIPLTSLVKTQDNCLLTTGIEQSTEGSNFILYKMDESFNTKWLNKYYYTGGDNYVTKVIESTSGNFFVVGKISTDDINKSKCFVALISSTGNQIWHKTLGNEFDNELFGASETKDHCFIVTGGRTYSEDGFAKLTVTKFDKKGEVLWDKNYGEEGTTGYDIIKANDKGYIVLAKTFSKIKIFKISETGQLLWQKSYGTGRTEGNQIISDNGNGYIVVGRVKSRETGWNALIFKIDNRGNQLWQSNFGGTGDEVFNSVTTTFDFGYVALGYTESKGNGKKDVWLVKLNQSIRERATQYVQNKINDWQKKGKYEKNADYFARVNENTRKLKIFEFTNEYYGQIGNPIFHNAIQKPKLDYDTESEVFRISMDYFNPIYIPVSITDAQNFEDNFAKLKFSNIVYNLTKDDKLEISQATIKNSVNGKTYFFDATKPVTFNDEVVVSDFDPIHIEPNPDITPDITPDNTDSDVDTDIPNIGKVYKNRYALIIGNAHYIENGSDMVDIKYSINDAKIFKQYAINVLGIPNDGNHIYYIEDANATYMRLYIDNFSKLIKSLGENNEFYVFYSGHGTQNEQNEAFIVPVGVTSDYINDFAIKLKDFYSQISPSTNQKVIVFLDACFSGGGKNGQLLVNAKTGLRRTHGNENLNANLLVFAASSAKQISQEYLPKKHGIFSYFLFKNLKDTKGNITYGDLADKIIGDVTSTTLNPQNNLNQQTPTINVNPAIQDVWKTWKLNP